MENKKIKILYITCFGTMQGGGQRSLYLLLKNINKDIFEPCLVVPEHADLEIAANELGVKVFVLPFVRLRSLNIFAIIKNIFELCSILRNNSINLMYTDSVRETLYAGIAGRILHLPVLLHLRVTDFNFIVDNILYYFVTKMIAVSKAAADRFKKIDKKGKVVVVYNGVDIDAIKPVEVSMDGNKLKIGFFGRLEERKGVDVFIKAVKIVNNLSLEAHIFGNGELDYVEKLKKMAGDCKNIFFEKFQENAIERMSKLDAVILPSRRGEGLSRAIIEAMGIGRPVIVSDIPSNPEAVGEELTDFIFKNGDEKSLADLFKRILKDRTILLKASKIARQRVEKYFDIKKNTKIIEEVYKNMVTEGQGAIEITSKAYDERVGNHTLDQLIDIYYEPKAVVDKIRIEEVLKSFDIRPSDKVLDIGCGVGTFAYRAAKKGAISYGIDYSVESIKIANILAKRYGLSDRVNYVAGDVKDLPFEDSFFDKITAIDFIEHITDTEKDCLLAEMKRVLKKDGKIVVFTPNRIREMAGDIYWNIRHILFKDKIPKTSLHYGLITRWKFESLLKKHGLFFKFRYLDVTRPYLAKIPILRHFLSLNLLWIVYKN